MNISMFKVPIDVLLEKAMKSLLIHGLGLLFVLAFSNVSAVCEKDDTKDVDGNDIIGVLNDVGVANSFQYPSSYKYSGQDFQPETPPNPGCGRTGGCRPGHLGEDWQIAPIYEDNTGKSKEMPVDAIANGCVTQSGYAPNGSGNLAGYVIMKHYLPNGSYVLSVFFHLRKEDTEDNKLQNTRFIKGEKIASTADSDEMDENTTFGSHLHFEIRGTSAQINWGNIPGWIGGDTLDKQVYYFAYNELSKYDFVEGGNGIIAYKEDFGGYFNPTELTKFSHEGSKTDGVLNHRGFIDYHAKPEHFEDFLCVFTDIIEGEQDGAHQEAIKKLCLKGVIKGFGNGTFGPTELITRAQFSKLLILTKLMDEKGLNVKGKNGRLPDPKKVYFVNGVFVEEVDENAPSFDENEKYSPTNERVWEDTLLEIRALKLDANENRVFRKDYFNEEFSSIIPVIPEEPFEDIKVPSKWYYQYVNTLGRLGIVGGYGVPGSSTKKEFLPDNKISKAEVIKMVLKGMAGISDIGGNGYWAADYLNCALNLSFDDVKYNLLILTKPSSEQTQIKCREAYEEKYPEQLDLCFIGQEPASRADAAFAIFRLRELKSAYVAEFGLEQLQQICGAPINKGEEK